MVFITTKVFIVYSYSRVITKLGGKSKMGLEEKFGFLGKDAIIDEDHNVVITIEQFMDILKHTYSSNENIKNVTVSLRDKEHALSMVFTDYDQFNKDQRQKVGDISVFGREYNKIYSKLFPERDKLTESRDGIYRITDASIDTLSELTLNCFRANEYVSAVTADLFDGYNYFQMSYSAPKVFQQDQSQRRGTIKIDEQVFR